METENENKTTEETLLKEGDLISVQKNDNGRVYFATINNTEDTVTNQIPLDVRKNAFDKGKTILYENNDYHLVDNNYVAQIPETQIFDMNFVHNSYKYKPKYLFINELKWKYLIRNVLQGENILMLGPSGSGKTLAANSIAKTLKRPFFRIPTGQTQDPRATLIGNTFFSKDKGTFFDQSLFVKAIQTDNAIILLDELSRAHPEAWNILMTVLDQDQRYLRLDEAEGQPTINVAKGVSFIGTANIGAEYTSTRVLDRALRDRFKSIEMDLLTEKEEIELLTLLYPDLDKKTIKSIAGIADETRKIMQNESPEISTSISTRMTVDMGKILNDDFALMEALEVCVLPFYDIAGGETSEREFIKTLIQKHIPHDDDDKDLFKSKEKDTKLSEGNPFEK